MTVPGFFATTCTSVHNARFLTRSLGQQILDMQISIHTMRSKIKKIEMAMIIRFSWQHVKI
jgi:hypothetical protein